MAFLDVSNATAILKEYYSDQRVTQLTYKDAPLYAMLEKRKDFYGENFPLPMRVTNPQGRSNTFTNAQNQKQPSKYTSFFLTRTKDYSLASITSEAIMASETNPGAFLRLATAEIDGAMESLKRSISWALYLDGTGFIGTQTGAPAAGKLTLTNSEDVVHFETNQTLEVWSAATGGTQRLFFDGTSKTVVQSVDRDAGTMVVSPAPNGGSATVASGDYIFVSGDRGAKLSGLAAWVPDTAPTSGDSFFGVDRSVDATRLSGSRLVMTGKPIDEAIIDMARRLGREGGNPDTVYLGFSKYASLEKTLQQRVQYEDTEVAGISFRGIVLNGPKGKITIYPDQDCPQNRGYMLKMDSWAFYSLKEPVQILNADGNQMLRESAADAYEVRIATYSQLATVEPRSNGVMKF